MKLRFLIALTLFIASDSLQAQERFTLTFTRKAEPKIGYDNHIHKFYYSPFKMKTDKGIDSSFRVIDGYQLMAGDFNDGQTKFTLTINTKEWKNAHRIYISPYASDSVIINGGVNSLDAEAGKIFSLAAFGKQYGAMLNYDLSSVTLFRLDGNYEKPDIRLYDSLMPNTDFKLITGETDKFSNYTHAHKYIFVMFWNTWQLGDTKDIDELKNISSLYKDALTVISFHRDTLVVKQMEKEENIDWIEAKTGEDTETLFPVTGAPDGILFNEDGRAVAFGLRPEELKPFIEKLLHVTN